MWLVADLFERYTSSVAKTFLRIAAREADANRKAMEDYRRRRQERVAHVVAADRRKSEVAQTAPKPAPKADASLSAATGGTAPIAELPMGVRADVVSGWVDRLAAAAPGEIAELTETLRKDKKVRVPELQWIAVGALGEEPAVRKKADHLAALREALGEAAARPAGPAEAPVALHA